MPHNLFDCLQNTTCALYFEILYTQKAPTHNVTTAKLVTFDLWFIFVIATFDFWFTFVIATFDLWFTFV